MRRLLLKAHLGALLLLLMLGACATHPALECVPYARERSGIAIRGDAWTWWDRARGRYERSRTPEPGAVLVFRRSRSLPAGHVAVVRSIRGPREIRIDHANWAGSEARKGMITENVAVLDVSPSNNWSSVRVAYGQSFGKPHDAFGFIHPNE